ncbi:dinitrogenase iron-molybdenum cofactor [Orenia metallireducens]|jgi:predicted Fe-Mo cluster-binding NifX family protein|uniref:Dinitrogenase iron-molybdenum cofactor n=1 Tax=Orenia metallireducens TaxID=1413210 RepID=A0A1C0A4U4_9FIRM|nr:NifB/NifX family molybdenum-iron cluster-binding protein [Orenia metallireducens]OCL25160.1 dinitrogenase iron-molybdenum cofactor [Orenia metallireducens]
MKIAIPSQGNTVAGHFGHCPEFTIVEVDNQEVVREERIANPGHKPGFLPKFLHGLEVNVILAGGMGQRAVDLFNQNQIEVVTGASGLVKDVVNSYLANNLELTDNICNHDDTEEHECSH